MTPEQKAFFEYGQAVARLVETRRNVRWWYEEDSYYQARPWRAKEAHRPYEAEDCEERRELVQAAWDAHKAARAWNPAEGRNCDNCLHATQNGFDTVCAACLGVHTHWTPQPKP